MLSARRAVAVTGAPTKSTLPACMAGKTPEYCIAAISILRPSSLPSASRRSMVKPSSPPLSLVMANGAATGSTAARSGAPDWARAFVETTLNAIRQVTMVLRMVCSFQVDVAESAGYIARRRDEDVRLLPKQCQRLAQVANAVRCAEQPEMEADGQDPLHRKAAPALERVLDHE